MKIEVIDGIDDYMFDDLFYFDKLVRMMKEWESFYDHVDFQKTHAMAVCPSCNSIIKKGFSIDKVENVHCENCFFDFVIQRVGSIYFIVAYNGEKA